LTLRKMDAFFKEKARPGGLFPFQSGKTLEKYAT
jgi:hypothetical protein